MNITVLSTFLKIVETGSLVKASVKLNVTQSTVTARLKLLEEDLGQTLIIRQKSGIKLTAAGEKLLRYAQVMTGLWEQARQETSLPDNVQHLCNIGCHSDLWGHLGRALSNEIHHNRADTALTIKPGEHAELEAWFASGLIDIALTFQPLSEINQTTHLLTPDVIELVSTRPNAPMIHDPHYVFVEHGDDFKRAHAEFYAHADIQKLSFGCAHWALDHILENGGTAYLPKRLVRSHLISGQLFSVENAPTFSRNIYLVTNDLALDNWQWLPQFVKELDAKRAQ